jgi:uncharacterized protein YyaL (SSP411 family)
MQKVLKLLVLVSLALPVISFIPPKNEKIKWMSLAELRTAYAKKPLPILIDVYTSWCGWCKVMDRDTYSNENVAGYINKNFYAVKFDAESTDSVVLGAKKYGFNPANKVNDLAVYLLYGQMGYPTTVFLSSIEAQPAPLAGYLKPAELEPPLKYFGDGAYRNQNFPDFMKVFKATW